MSVNKLIQAILEKNNPTVAGLDPKLDYVPPFIKEKCFAEHGTTLRGAAEAIFEFNKTLIDSLCDVVPAVKPQSAYYEMYGYEGVRTLHRTIEYAHSKGMYVIVDGKRNDIGSTAQAYATAYLGETLLAEGISVPAFGGDALTVSAYLGTDGIAPFTAYDKMIFALVKTSNPSSGDLQDCDLPEGKVYQHVAKLCAKWGESSLGDSGYTNVGIVAGATYPEQLSDLRARLPHAYFLVPGYGAQGGKASDVARAFNPDGLGAIINASRSIMCAYKKSERPLEEFGQAARDEAIRMRDDIISAIAARSAL